MPDVVLINLSNPAIFHDLNQLEGIDENHIRYELAIRLPKFKDLPKLKTCDYHGKVQYCALELASLSLDDLDELSTSDGKKMVQVVLEGILRFNEACKDYWHKEQQEVSNG